MLTYERNNTMPEKDGFYKELHRAVGAAVLANKVKFMSVKQVSRACSTLQEGEEDLEPALTKADVKAMMKKHSALDKAEAAAKQLKQTESIVEDKLDKLISLANAQEARLRVLEDNQPPIV